MWNTIDTNENGKFEIFTPRDTQIPNSTTSGAKQSAVKVRDMRLDGRGSGLLNTWVISGLALYV